ncbi:helix-turn-helix domain-containing protein [Actinophytocola sp.]|uniref:helix-turn-helix domain-containing protein n=1 Tax=Actinophytocola sp. TaxID=1872138 RepID=UPI002D7EB54E|nr:helix-turn-helix domain-containing protein [Actinophytocola sp.]HET9141313.1 helix-turn-helix domain-containing protein [Actinophytocola sp.]
MDTVGRWTGRETRALRVALRLSVRAFAERLGVAARTVSKWEKGGERTIPWPDTQAILDTCLSQASGEVRARLSALLMRPIAAEGFNTDERHHVVAVLKDAPRFFDGPLAEYCRRQLDICIADDGELGPAATLPAVLELLRTIETHGRDVRPSVRRELLSVGASGAEFAGWLLRDMREPGHATFWYDRAMEWAQEAGDLPMQGYMLLKKSQMAYDARDALRVLTLAQAAMEGPWQLPANVRAEVTQQHALGMAMIGEPLPAVERRLDHAHELLAQVKPDDQPDRLGAYFTAQTLLLRNASSFTEAGRPGRAAALFGEVLSTAVLSRRDAGYFRARRAVALALSGEPDEAAAVGLGSVEIALATDSRRTLRVLNEVMRTLAPWRSRPAVREFGDVLARHPAR